MDNEFGEDELVDNEFGEDELEEDELDKADDEFKPTPLLLPDCLFTLLESLFPLE